MTSKILKISMIMTRALKKSEKDKTEIRSLNNCYRHKNQEKK